VGLVGVRVVVRERLREHGHEIEVRVLAGAERPRPAVVPEERAMEAETADRLVEMPLRRDRGAWRRRDRPRKLLGEGRV
jgi:hypothetical protein